LARSREAERDAELSALYFQHYDSLRRLAFVSTGDGGLAEEIVMDVFVKALSTWSSFKRVDWPPAYLRRMVVNLARTRMRRKKIENRVNALFHEPEERSSVDVEAYGISLDLWEAVRALPARQRECIVLRYLEGMTEPEVAQVLDCPVGTVKSQLSRARGKLAKLLGEDAVEGEA
jgi:RNA polymerase sigma-70 factor (sigma-E family)